MDAKDPLAWTRERFILPDGVIYLDGNSLGALPRSTPARLSDAIEREWGRDLIKSWNVNHWIELPARIGARLAHLIGAAADEVIAADSTSVNLFKAAAAALRHQAPRRVILSEAGNFPTDLYILQGLEDLVGAELRMVPRQQLEGALDGDTALLMLTHSHYKTGDIHDMAALTARAHEAGALTLWDLSHSAGAMPLDLDGAGCDLAVGCGYKYLNGGPGAPAFLYVAKRLQHALRNPLSGWMGHAEPFAFADLYAPAQGVSRMLCGTPAVLAMAAFEEGLKTFDGVDLGLLREKSRRLGDLFLDLAGPEFALACPRDSKARGSQISLRHPHGYAIIQALIARGVIGDFRAPDILRFGFAPLYLRYADVFDAVEALHAVMREDAWRDEKYSIQAAVT